VTSPLEAFLAEVEVRALRMAELRLGDRDRAHDAVQDAMIRLVRKYGSKPESEWRPLFFRILGNRIVDMQRSDTLKRCLFMERRSQEQDDPIDHLPAAEGDGPSQKVDSQTLWSDLGQAIRQLPARQQQTVVLRLLEGLSVTETAEAMGCSEGSVKTQYSRGLARLREKLGRRWQYDG